MGTFLIIGMAIYVLVWGWVIYEFFHVYTFPSNKVANKAPDPSSASASQAIVHEGGEPFQTLSEEDLHNARMQQAHEANLWEELREMDEDTGEP